MKKKTLPVNNVDTEQTSQNVASVKIKNGDIQQRNKAQPLQGNEWKLNDEKQSDIAKRYFIETTNTRIEIAT